MLISYEDAMDAIVRLNRTVGYPRDPGSLTGLVDGLVQACNKTGIEPSRVIDKCLELSKFCPTDFDLLATATALRSADTPTEMLLKPWRAPEAPSCEFCYGTGWRIVTKGKVTGAQRCSCGAKVQSQYEDVKGAA